MTLSPPTIPISCLAPHSNLPLKPRASDQQNLRSRRDSWSAQLGHSRRSGILQGMQVSSSRQVVLTQLSQSRRRSHSASATRRQVKTLPRFPLVHVATPQPRNSISTSLTSSTPFQLRKRLADMFIGPILVEHSRRARIF